jgi:hypothetical protein
MTRTRKGRGRESNFFDDYEEPDELQQLVAEGKLPASAIVTGEQLTMRPGQSVNEKMRELGTTHATLHRWFAEWRGSGFNPHYVIRRSTTDTRPGRYAEKDWPAAVRDEIAKGRARHIGDVLIELGLNAGRVGAWSQKYADFEQALWHSGVRYPKRHWRDFVGWIRGSTIERYRELKAEHIAQGMPETEAMHRAADEAINELKHATRQRRRVERDILEGVTMGEERTKRWQKGGRLWDAHSKRIAKKLVKVARYTAMERGLRESGYTEEEIEAKINDLKAAFAQSPDDGQVHWQKLRKGILRKKARTEAQARADKAEARAIEQMPGVKATKYLKQQIAR